MSFTHLMTKVFDLKNKGSICEIDKYGNKYWIKDDKCHRLDGPAIEYISGYKEWWVNGKIHRIDGPAREHSNGYKEWWVNGKLHRLDGPAKECPNGQKEWYYEDEYITYDSQEEFERILKLRMLL